MLVTTNAVMEQAGKRGGFFIASFGLVVLLPALACHALADDALITARDEGLAFDGFWELTETHCPWSEIEELVVRWRDGNADVTWKLRDGRLLSIENDEFWGLDRTSVQELMHDHAARGVSVRLVTD